MNFVYNHFMARKRSLETLLKSLRQQIPLLAERYGVETLEVFGSYARAEQKPDSDLDVLVTFQEAAQPVDLYRDRELFVGHIRG